MHRATPATDARWSTVQPTTHALHVTAASVLRRPLHSVPRLLGTVSTVAMERLVLTARSARHMSSGPSVICVNLGSGV